MKTHLKLLALLLMLLMIVQSTMLSTFAIVQIDVDDTNVYLLASKTGYTQTSDVKYNYSGNYVYNWGYRGETVTFLSPMAVSFYTSNYDYDILSQKSGGTSLSESSAANSALYDALQNLMSSKQTYQTSYNATKDLFMYTDCQGGGGKISSFYSGMEIGPSWDGRWNREHCWPNSKGDASGNGENDIMMLRPTSTSENSSRGNKAYGEGSGYYNPNNESNGTYDLRGDVARIVLYTYVRWDCTNTGSKYNPNGITGTDGVIQSITVLLKWIEEDPVDTWELGRNDAVQAITGTRNVFVDYPEYAFLLFGQEIPSDMVTPSGEAMSNGHHWDGGSITTQATCTNTGVKTYTCTDSGCGETKTETIAALNHSYNSGSITTAATCVSTGTKTYTCSRCSTTKTETIKALGHSYSDWVIDKNATETETGEKHRVCSTCNNTETATIPLLGHEHNYTNTVTPPTCTDEGYTTHTCACGDQYIDSHTDKIAHSYSNGICSVCTTKDPNAPVFSTKDFDSIVTRITSGLYTGKERYVKICEALTIYNTFSARDKENVEGNYSALVKAIALYNEEVAEVNNDAQEISFRVHPTSVASIEMVCFAVYTFCKKKEI